MTAVNYTGLGDFRKAIDKHPIYREAGIPASAEGRAPAPPPSRDPRDRKHTIVIVHPTATAHLHLLQGKTTALVVNNRLGKKGDLMWVLPDLL